MIKNRLFKPHRGNKSTMNTGIKKTMVLAAGEMFIEVPDTGQGTGHCKMKIGDGMNIYPNLPYAMGDITNDVIEVIEEDESPDVETALNKIKSGAKLNTIISALKRTCQLVETAVTVDLIQKIYPVGSIFLSTSDVNPGTYLGGTWELLKDKFLLGAGGSYAGGTSGGQASVTLTTDQIPAHNHGGSTNTAGPEIKFAIYNTGSAKSGNDLSNVYHLRGIDGSWAGGYNGCTGYYKNTAHSHSISTSNAGGGQSHNNMPPYLAVYMWKRTA